MNLSNFHNVDFTWSNQHWWFQGLQSYFVDCCTKITISSDGVLKELDFKPASGLYQYFVQNNGKRAYKQEHTTYGNGVFYLHWSPFNTWTVYHFIDLNSFYESYIIIIRKLSVLRYYGTKNNFRLRQK